MLFFTYMYNVLLEKAMPSEHLHWENEKQKLSQNYTGLNQNNPPA